MGGKRRRRSRSRSGESGVSRRAFLTGSLSTAASGALVTGSGAFSQVTADRSTSVGVADDPEAVLEIAGLGNVVDDPNRGTEVARIRNNFDETVSLDVDVAVGAGIEVASGFEAELSPGEETRLSAVCDSGSGAGTTTLDVTVDAATGESVSVEGASHSVEVERDCSVGPFRSLSAEDLPENVGESDDVAQTFTFTPDGTIEAASHVDVDLSDATENGVSYDYVESSDNGDAWLSGDTIRYPVGDDGKSGEGSVTVVVGSTGEAGASHDASFVRTDTGAREATAFAIEGRTSGTPFSAVAAEDLPAGVSSDHHVAQTFTFTPDETLEADTYVDVDLSDAIDSGVSYDYVESSDSGDAWLSGDTVRYPIDDGGKSTDGSVTVRVSGTAGEQDSVGVTFTRTDTGYADTTDFAVEDPYAGRPFPSVAAEDVPANVGGGDSATQTFTFTPDGTIEAGAYVDIDLSDADPDVQYGYVESSDNGDAWLNGDTIRYPVGNDGKSTEGTVSVTLDSTGESGGPFDVPFTRTDTGYRDVDSFAIE